MSEVHIIQTVKQTSIHSVFLLPGFQKVPKVRFLPQIIVSAGKTTVRIPSEITITTVMIAADFSISIREVKNTSIKA